MNEVEKLIAVRDGFSEIVTILDEMVVAEIKTGTEEELPEVEQHEIIAKFLKKLTEVHLLITVLEKGAQ